MASRSRGRLVGLFHLSEDLRFAQHHAVQARRHAEEVAHRRFVGVDEEMGHDLARIEPMESRQKNADLIDIRHRARLAGRIDLDAIAGGKQHALDIAEGASPLAQGLVRLLPSEGQPLANRDCGRVMATADDLQIHGSTLSGRAAHGIIGRGSTILSQILKRRNGG